MRRAPGRGIAIAALVGAMSVLTACGSDDGQSGTSKRLSGQRSCDLVSARELQQVTGVGFDGGQPEGPQCSFSSAGGPVPLVMTGAGVSATGAGGGVALDVEPEDIEVDGVPARQARTRPGGSMCAVDVLLQPDDASQMYSVVFSGRSAAGQDACGSAVKIASKILTKLPE